MGHWDGDGGHWDGDKGWWDGAMWWWDGAMGHWDGDMGHWDGDMGHWDGDKGHWDGDMGCWKHWDRELEHWEDWNGEYGYWGYWDEKRGHWGTEGRKDVPAHARPPSLLPVPPSSSQFLPVKQQASYILVREDPEKAGAQEDSGHVDGLGHLPQLLGLAHQVPLPPGGGEDMGKGSMGTCVSSPPPPSAHRLPLTSLMMVWAKTPSR